MIHNGAWVVLADDAFGPPLDLQRGRPWLVDILRWHKLQGGDPVANVGPIGIGLLGKQDWRIHPEILGEKGACAKT